MKSSLYVRRWYIKTPLLFVGLIFIKCALPAFNWGLNLLLRKMASIISMSPKGTIPQTITFAGTDTIDVVSRDVTVQCNNGSHNAASSKVRHKSIVDYNWEHRLYSGSLVAVHISGKYFAYGIRITNQTPNVGVVRVVNRQNGERFLIKGMKGQIQDISFAHIPTEVILGCVDEEGSLFVHSINTVNEKIVCTLLLHVVHKTDPSILPTHHRVIWCPYLPETLEGEDGEISEVVDQDDDTAKLLVLTHGCEDNFSFVEADKKGVTPNYDTSNVLVFTYGCKAEMWNVGMVNVQYGPGPHDPSDITEGFLVILEHSQPIVDATFSPDGTALATASLDGDVKFFQVYMHNENTPRCLHQWKPHKGNELSSLFFLDDHQTFNSDVQFWKYAITGCSNNTELKLWSCEDWTCLQTIHFTPNPNSSVSNIQLKAGIDRTASYLLLSDINNRALYVLQICKDMSKKNSAFVCSISEFLLHSPIFCFGIINIGLHKSKSPQMIEDVDSLDDANEADDVNSPGTMITMYVVEPRKLQECAVMFEPNPAMTDGSISVLTEENLCFRETAVIDQGSEDSEGSNSVVQRDTAISRVNGDGDSDPINNLIVNTENLPILPSAPQTLNLMTPDAFNSPIRRESNSSKSHSNKSASKSPPVVQNGTSAEDNLAVGELPTSAISYQKIKDNFASGNSSPSREVQEIMSLNSQFKTHGFYQNDLEKSMDSIKSEPDQSLKYSDTNDLITNSIPEYDNVPGSSDFTKTNNSDGWPKIPIMKVNEVRKSEENRLSNNQEKESISDEYDNKKYLKVLTQKVNILVERVKEQNDVIGQLQRQIAHINQKQFDKEPDTAHLEDVLTNRIDEAFSQQLAEQNKMLESWMLSRATKEREYQECLMSAVSQVIGNHMIDKLDTVVSSEVKKNIIPSIYNVLEPLKRQLHTEFSQKLTATDDLLKDNLSKLVHSKSVMDVLSSSVVSSLKPVIETSYKEMITNTLLTSWERVCQQMFQQMHGVFVQGTKEYTGCLENYLEKQRNYLDKQTKAQEKGRDIVTQLQSVSDTMKTNSEHLATTLSNEIQQQMQKTFTSFQESVKKNVRQEVKDQVEKSFKCHVASFENSVVQAVKSRAVTPAPHVIDAQVQQAQIQQLISVGNYNQAFQQALSASDLSLVVYTCEKVNPQDVFDEQCRLQQHVLLSLIQQLSADMTNHTELKLRYLEEAVMNLQMKNSATREHLPIILKDLQRQLGHYLAVNPNSTTTRGMKMLLMAANSLLAQISTANTVIP